MRAYKTYIRPILEAGSVVWNPHLCKDVDLLEKVQKYYTRRLYRRCGYQRVDYMQRLQFLDLETLEKRRTRFDLIECYKILGGETALDREEFFETGHSGTRGHDRKIATRNCRINARKFFFANRVVSKWNNLTQREVSANSLKQFKNLLVNIDDRVLRFR